MRTTCIRALSFISSSWQSMDMQLMSSICVSRSYYNCVTRELCLSDLFPHMHTSVASGIGDNIRISATTDENHLPSGVEVVDFWAREADTFCFDTPKWQTSMLPSPSVAGLLT